MVRMWRTGPVGNLVFGLCIALTPGAAQAAFLTGGTTFPNKGVSGGSAGGVDVQVYTLGGGGSYGTGNLAADAAIALLPGAGVNPFLYLYETSNLGPDITVNGISYNTAIGGAPGIIAGFQFGATGGGVPGDPSGFTPLGDRGIVVAAGATIPFAVAGTPTSVSAVFIPAMGPGGHSTLWGYVSPIAPSLASTSIQDNGTSAEG